MLVDSPIEVGNQHVHSFEVDGVKHEVSIFAPKPIDEAPFVADIRKIVEQTVPVFGEVPYLGTFSWSTSPTRAAAASST